MNNIAYAIAKHIRISDKKLSPIVSQLRGKTYKESLKYLQELPHKKRIIIWKVLYSAISNLLIKQHFEKDSIKIIKAYVTKGSRLKRVAARAKGKAYHIEKKMSHLTIFVGGLDI